MASGLLLLFVGPVVQGLAAELDAATAAASGYHGR